MIIHILYGTETGNAELVADDIFDQLNNDFDAICKDMADVDLNEIHQGEGVIVVCSTYGEGELPNSAQPFYLKLKTENPNLDGVKFATFGLGDSFYETFNRGSEIIADELTRLRGLEIGARGVHDASSGQVPSDVALEWLSEIIPAFTDQ